MSDKRILTLNAGSSSLKLALFEACSPPRRLFGHTVARMGGTTPEHEASLDAALSAIEPHGGLAAVAAVGHRIVHGGAHHADSQPMTADVLDALRGLAILDPDHMPAELALVDALRARAPALPQVACFDTAFHRTMARVARLLPIPRRYEEEGVRRYGFHGLSYTFLVEELARVAGDRAARGRVVMAHLGSGSSLAGLLDGRSVDTTMGFTPNSGIPMGTRSGDIDPGVVLYLLRVGHLDPDALDDVLSRRSGLLGVSGTSSDMRDLLARRATDPRAGDAVALYCCQARKAVGALVTALGGLDTLVFSGGIGENAPPVRSEIARGLEHLGVHLDEARNEASSAVISADGSACTVRVIRTDEESVIARETLRVTVGPV
jgi:acetate kinase